jgi:hypothetical protein
MLIARHDSGHYGVSAGNGIEQADGAGLLRRIEALASLDKAALKAAYKEQLRKPREAGAHGAGLGLLEISRKASTPLLANLRNLDDGRAYVSLRAVI